MSIIVSILGIPTYIDFGETVTVMRGSGWSSYEDEISGVTTDIGFFIIIASGMLAWRVYHWVISGEISGDLPIESRITWRYWLAGLFSYVLISTPLLYMEIHGFLQRIIALSMAIGVARFFYLKHAEAICEARRNAHDKGSESERL
jgi:hypothetical protein